MRSFNILRFLLLRFGCRRLGTSWFLLHLHRSLAATRRRYGSLIGAGRRWWHVCLFPRSFLLLVHLFLDLEVLLLCPAALPAVLPVADEEIEAECVDLHAWLEADAKIAIVHLVLVNIGMQEVEMTGDGEEEVIIVWREFGELVLQ